MQLTLVWNRFLTIHQYMGVVYTAIYHNKKKCHGTLFLSKSNLGINPFLKYGIFLLKYKKKVLAFVYSSETIIQRISFTKIDKSPHLESIYILFQSHGLELPESHG